MPINLHFDWLAPHYDRAIGAPDVELFKRLLKLPDDVWLLDVGGGTGRVTELLRPYVKRLTIADLSLPMLKTAMEKEIACVTSVYSHRLPFPENSFERILVVDAMHHFHDQMGAMREMIRVLKPGGRLLIEEPNIHKFPVKLIALAEKLALMGSHFYTPEKLGEMAEQAGGQVEIELDERIGAWIMVDK